MGTSLLVQMTEALKHPSVPSTAKILKVRVSWLVHGFTANSTAVVIRNHEHIRQ